MNKHSANVTVGEIMIKDVISLNVHDPAINFWDVFKHRRFNHCPVISNERKIVGVVSNTDMHTFMNVVRILDDKAEMVTVGDIMTKPAFTLEDDVTIDRVAKAMADNKIHSIVITDGEDQVKGIVTATDLLNYLSGL